MAFKIPVRCGETTTTTGTGTVTTNGAPLQMQTFNAGVGTGNTCPYMIVSGDNVNWERGLGTVTVSGSVTTVARTTVVESSAAANAAISLVGTSFIFVALPGDVANTNGLLDLVFGSSNGTYNLVRSGGVWTVAVAGVSSGSGLFAGTMSGTTPTQANTGLNTWANQPTSSTVTDEANGIAVFEPAQGSNHTHALIQKDISGISTPYSFTALITCNARVQSFHGPVFGFADGTKTLAFYIEYSGFFGVATSSAYTAGAVTWKLQENDGVLAPPGASAVYWLKVQNDGTNLNFYNCRDGVDWGPALWTELVGATLANRNKLVFGCDNYAVASTTKLLDFKQGT